MESNGKFLAKDRFGHTNVFLCRHGIVHLNYMNTTLRFRPKDFNRFALLVSDAYYRLNNDPALLDEIMED